MKRSMHRLLARVTGKNLKSTPTSVISDQLREPRPLPMGMTEFHEWSDRIIGGALIPHDASQHEIFVEGQKFALANMIIHLGPTESHKPDAHFIHSLRKYAINQVADTVRKEIKGACEVRLKAEGQAKEENPV